MNLVELFKSLGDETRLRIVTLLHQQQLCVCEMVEITGLSQPKISRHIARLRTSDIVVANRNEQYVYYSLNRDLPELPELLDWIARHTTDAVFKADQDNLRMIESFVCTR